ncbi:Unknown protein sequence [Pseudomonas amygdali pv. lachrymans]|uniref:DUF1534 domain-containing protein n=1 Tax=Pseudomonas amygdali pv. lachrymans TaxID=53707 RepID=A0ABR5KMM0_PSEAV|nr:Unknown protein sequence [Pseudomonas amygdali pv. lachrymans]KPC15666.1 Unknown protein sequence [Pseudomonas amygdali pv. lachrymans]
MHCRAQHALHQLAAQPTAPAPSRCTTRYTQVCFRFWPKAVGANLFAKGSAYSPKMHRLNDLLRGQARSYTRTIATG